MNLEDFGMPLLGGALIGAAGAMLLVTTGKVAGISGIIDGLVRVEKSELDWKVTFLIGLVLGGLAMALWHPSALPNGFPVELPWLIVAGLLVGFGTRMGGGCTSGHGVCGIGRLNIRGLVGTIVFMALGIGTVVAVRAIREAF